MSLGFSVFAKKKKRYAPKGQTHLTAFQSNCVDFLVKYAGFSRIKLLKNMTGSQIAEAARLICIRDGHPDWIAFVSDWVEGQQK